MTTTVDALLREHLLVARFANHLSFSLSAKNWGPNTGTITDRNNHPPTWEGVHRYLGPGLDLAPENYNPNYECPSAQYRLYNAVQRLNFTTETIVMEGEVQRDFDRYLGLPLALAFHRSPVLEERSLSGPPGHGATHPDSDKTIDTYFSWGSGPNEIPCIIGDLKKPGIIKPEEWNGQHHMGSVSRKLGKEIRGYAHLYNCPQVFVYDSLTLLLVQFQAQNRNDIKNPQVPVDVWVIPRTGDQGTCTARYALYWTAWRGLMRVIGQQDNPVAEWNGSRRYFQYFSGRPYWQIPGQGSTFFHPDGLTRKCHVEGYFYWSRTNAATGMEQTIPDTLTMW